MTICATVVSIPLPGYATLDAGTKSLTSDLSASPGSYGLIQEHPDVALVKLNEEHGYLRYDPEKYRSLLAIGCILFPTTAAWSQILSMKYMPSVTEY